MKHKNCIHFLMCENGLEMFMAVDTMLKLNNPVLYEYLYVLEYKFAYT